MVKKAIMKPVIILAALWIVSSCSKKESQNPPGNPSGNGSFAYQTTVIDGKIIQPFNGISVQPLITLKFSSPVNKSSATGKISLATVAGSSVPVVVSFAANDSSVIVLPTSRLQYLTRYKLTANASLTSASGTALGTAAEIPFYTAIDSSDKFPIISDSALVTLVQQQTFKYFWDFAHPVSGLARERSNGDNNVVTSGGSGFGVMAIIVGINRGFITRAQGLQRLQTIVAFLKNTAQRFHGAYPHWINGTTGAVIPFSAKDNGADLVETSYLLQGLLCARQYFNGSDASETALRNDVNSIWQSVEWTWFRQNNQNVLYWHWSPTYNWDMNVQIKGWNEALITYVLAASSPTYSIQKIVYDNGWAGNGGIKNGATYFGYTLPLGPNLGGPLFFEHYSFSGINPFGLTDAYANYQTQTVNHTKINYEYCKANPKGWYGYSDACWGLTASDVSNGYTASSPTNDVGVIAPTAALSSFPYTPTESMMALKFFYYKLGDKLWGDYGFKDAFSLQEPWFAQSYLAIDEGPITVMMENYRSGLLWKLFMSCPEVKSGLTALGFQSPHL